MNKITIKMKIRKLEKSFIRDRWNNLTNCYWNKIIKDDILKLKNKLDNANN